MRTAPTFYGNYKMCSSPKILFTILTSLFLIANPIDVKADVAKPSRVECIIGYYLDWSGIQDPIVVQKAMGWRSLRQFRSVAGFSFSDDSTQLYLQFFDHCEEKERMAKKITELWKSKGLNLPNMKRMKDPIKISPYTIDISGPEWRD